MHVSKAQRLKCHSRGPRSCNTEDAKGVLAKYFLVLNYCLLLVELLTFSVINISKFSIAG